LALIWAAAADELPPDDAVGAADEGGAETAAELAAPLALADGLEPDDEPPPLLLQAATATVSTATEARKNTLTG
jgi:hypothetical protein